MEPLIQLDNYFSLIGAGAYAVYDSRQVQTLFATLCADLRECPRDELSVVAREPFEGR
jgi:hypothetical protein